MSQQPTHQAPKALVPRRLDQKETLNSLNQWKTTFRNYYRRCPYYGLFLLPATTWDNSPTRGFSAENSGLNRDIPILVADLEGFLDCVASFLPFDYTCYVYSFFARKRLICEWAFHMRIFALNQTSKSEQSVLHTSDNFVQQSR